jgi:hypothetical protein
MAYVTEFLRAQVLAEFDHLPRQQLPHLLADYREHVIKHHEHVKRHGTTGATESIAAEQRHLEWIVAVYHGEIARRVEGSKQELLKILNDAAITYDQRVRDDGVVTPTVEEILAERAADQAYPAEAARDGLSGSR